jgi:hypothetical protein
VVSNADLIKRCRSGAEIYQEGLDDDDIGAALLDAADALEAHEWRTDMENAPRDEPVLVSCLGEHRIAILDPEDGEWWCAHRNAIFGIPDAWKPLDTPPDTQNT